MLGFRMKIYNDVLQIIICVMILGVVIVVSEFKQQTTHEVGNDR